YMIILGEKEVESNSVSLRLRTGEQINGIPVDKFISDTLEKIENKVLI
ncbi:MAG: hypothetical protein KAR21_10470, partial [Spirochaetales bacterium]|nr:hypothetical protein [Spirochaetales bacterium]